LFNQLLLARLLRRPPLHRLWHQPQLPLLRLVKSTHPYQAVEVEAAALIFLTNLHHPLVDR
jgi:hypothetical protein